MDSELARTGVRYYQADEGYDKRIYENSNANYLRIFITLCGFWLFNGLHWWAIFEFGIFASGTFMWYSIIAFTCSILFGLGMLTNGSRSNKLKRYSEFLKEKIEEKKTAAAELLEKEKQEKLYQAKLEAAKLTEIATGKMDPKSGMSVSGAGTKKKGRNTNLGPQLIADN
jgi:hypothetical protein